MIRNTGAARPMPGCPFAEYKADLHLHSVYSDGLKTPAGLCRMAVKAHVNVLSLTDHDTAAGCGEMRAAAIENGLAYLPGVEISTGAGGKVHVLAYGPAVESRGMQEWLAAIAADRQQRAAEMIRRLEQNGISLSQEVCRELLRNPAVGRPHIARALVETGAASNVRQAFDRWLVEGKPGYVPRAHLLTRDAVRTVRDLGAVPVLAHPTQTGLEWPALYALVEDLRSCGLMGVEAWHSCASRTQARQLDGMARASGLLVTGGSDYHGDAGSTVQVGKPGWAGAQEDIDRLMAVIG